MIPRAWLFAVANLWLLACQPAPRGAGADVPAVDAATSAGEEDVFSVDVASNAVDDAADAAPNPGVVDGGTSDTELVDAAAGDTAAGDTAAGETAAGDSASQDADQADLSAADAPETKDADSGADSAVTPDAASSFWVTGYYAAWMKPHLPPEAIDFSALTSVVNFSIFPKANGTFDLTSNGITPAETKALVKAAHAHGRQALLGVGGAWTHDGFAAWMKPSKRADFVQLVVQQVSEGGYDGVDLDMEPVYDSDAADFVPFVKDLRAALDAKDPKLLLTAAVGWREAVYAPVKKHFDRIGVMTYDLSGAWPGWETWHNSPLSNGGLKFASTQQPLPSCQTLVDEALAAKAPLGKLGIGIVFYAYVWQGASGPNQPIAGVSVKANMPYFELMDTLYDPAALKWHGAAQAPYLSIGQGAKATFVSFDSAQSIAAKIAWAKSKGLGGVIIWELGGGWRSQKPPGKQDLLLQAVKAAAWP